MTVMGRGSENLPQQRTGGESTNLADILERVLDKGLVIAGDIQVNLLDIELLTIKVRLVIASLETAKEVGIDWWEHDPWLTGNKAQLETRQTSELEQRRADQHQELEIENQRLRERLSELELQQKAPVEAPHPNSTHNRE